MKKGIKRIIALICAAVTVVSSLTYYPSTTVDAAIDYSCYTMTDVTVETNGTYQYSVVKNTIGIAAPEFYGADYMKFAYSGENTTANTIVKYDGVEKTADDSEVFEFANGMVTFYLPNLADNQYHTIEINGKTGDYYFVLKKGDVDVTDYSATQYLQDSNYNMALNKDFEVGLNGSQEGNGNITDGVLGVNGDYYVSTTFGKAGTYYVIDLGQTYAPDVIDSIYTWFRSRNKGTMPYNGGYKIQYSYDGIDYVEVADVPESFVRSQYDSSGESEPYVIKNTVNASSSDILAVRYVKIHYPNAIDYGAQVCEIAVMDIDGGEKKTVEIEDVSTTTFTASNTGSFKIGGTIESVEDGYTYDIYLDDVLVAPNHSAGEYSINATAGEHIVGVRVVSPSGFKSSMTEQSVTVEAPFTYSSTETKDTVFDDANDYGTNLVTASEAKRPGVTATADTGNAGFAIDANMGTRWESEHNKDPQKIIVDLGKVCSVKDVEMIWEGAQASDYTVEVSKDGVNYEVVAMIDSSMNKHIGNRYDKVVLSQAVDARYVKINGTARYDNYGYSIYELAVYGVEGKEPSTSEPVTTTEKQTETTTVAQTTTEDLSQVKVPAVANVSGKGDFGKITIDWTNNTDHIFGYQYYVYLDDPNCENEPVATATQGPIDIPAARGLHTVTVVAEYKGIKSEPKTVTNEPISYVYNPAAEVAGLAAVSTIDNPKVVNVQWTPAPDATYEVRLVKDGNEEVFVTSGVGLTSGSYNFDNVSAGDYDLYVTESIYNVKSGVTQTVTTKYEEVVHVYDTIADPPGNITFDEKTGEITWQEARDAVSYNIYIEGPDGVITTALTDDDVLVASGLTVTNEIVNQVRLGRYTIKDQASYITKPGIYLIKMTSVNHSGESSEATYKMYERMVDPVQHVVAVASQEDNSISVSWNDESNYTPVIYYDVYLNDPDFTKEPALTVLGETSAKLTNVPEGIHTVYVRARYSYQQKVYDTNRVDNIDYQYHLYRSSATGSNKVKIYGDAEESDITISNNTGALTVTWNKQMTAEDTIDTSAKYVVKLLQDGEVKYTSDELTSEDLYETMDYTFSSVESGTYDVVVSATVDGTTGVDSTLELVFVYPLPIALENKDVIMIDDDTMAQTVIVQIDTESMQEYARYTAILIDEEGNETEYKATSNSSGYIVLKDVPAGTYTMKIITSINGRTAEMTYDGEIIVEHLVFPSKLTASCKSDNAISVGWTIGDSSEYQGCEFTAYIYNADDVNYENPIATQTTSGGTNVTITNLPEGDYRVSAKVSDGEYESKLVRYEGIVRVYAPIDAPANVTAEGAEANSMKFAFDKVKDAKDYIYTVYDKEGNALEAGVDYNVGEPVESADTITYTLTNLRAGKYYVAVMAIRNDGKNSSPNASEYVEISGANISEVSSVQAIGADGVKKISWTTEGATIEGQKFNVYIDDKLVATTQENSYQYEFEDAGYHTVRVTSVYGQSGTIEYTESEGFGISVNVQFADDTIKIKSDADKTEGFDLCVEGFQINTNLDTVNIRVISKAPKKGTVITGTDDKTYTVKGYGTLYALDQNGTGIKRHDKLDNSYLKLGNTLNDRGFYDGVKSYAFSSNGMNISVAAAGYAATDKGVMENWKTEDTTHDYYSCTMENMSIFMANDIHVRAFLIVTDSEGNEQFIYSKEAAAASIAQIANHLYKNSMSRNYFAHKYLYDNILSSNYLTSKYVYNKYQNLYGDNNVFYRTTTLTYGWNDYLFTPGPQSILSQDTLDELNN